MVKRIAAAAVLMSLTVAAVALPTRAQLAPVNAPSPAARKPAPVRAPASGAPAPGTAITAKNAAAFARYIPRALAFAIAHGFTADIVASRHLGWSKNFLRATEKYSPQVRLNDKDEIANYVAGMPFPLVSLTDPKAAVKIAYNWHMGPFMPDDFTLAPWTSTAYAPDPRQPGRLMHRPRHDFACSRFDFLRFAHRTEVPPLPTLGENPQGLEWKTRCREWTTDVTAQPALGGAGIWVRYLDPDSPDEFWGFNEETRRLRRDLTLQQPDHACRGCHQPYWAYALPKTEAFTYRLLGTTSILACLTAKSESAGIVPADDDFRLSSAPFEMRRAYILEMTPKDVSQHYLSQVVDIDSETYTWLAARFYENGVLTASAIPLWRTHPAREGGNLFDLAGSFYVTAGPAPLLRSLVPAGQDFSQRIDTGALSESDFNPAVLGRH